MSTQSVDSNALHGVVHACLAADLPVEVINTAARLGVARQLREVLTLTRDLFGEVHDVRAEDDPEILADTHIVFTVKAKGSLNEILQKNDEWHGRLPDLATELSGVFCLSIDVQ